MLSAANQPARVDNMIGKAVLQRSGVATGRKWLTAIALATVVVGLSANICKAQCVELSGRVPPIVIQTFSSEPASLLRELRNEKAKLVSRVAAFVVTDISLLPSVRRLVSDAPTADRAAIGAGLRRAEARCLAPNPQAAQKINDFVRKLGDNAVSSGYAAEAEEPAAPSPRRNPPAGSSAGLLTGEWKTELADPFKPLPLP
jgi:hypothetical protein